MRFFKSKPPPAPLPMSPLNYLVEGLGILAGVEADIETLVLDLHNALHCLDESGFATSADTFRAQQLITALRVVQAL